MQINNAIQDLRMLYSQQLIVHNMTPDQHCSLAKIRYKKLASTIWSCKTLEQVRNMETFAFGFQHQVGVDKRTHDLGFTRTVTTVLLQVSLTEILELKVKQLLTKQALDKVNESAYKISSLVKEIETIKHKICQH